MATILITGGTGMIGTQLTKQLISKGHTCIILTRKAKPANGNIIYKEWDAENGSIDKTAISEADYIIHLAGANVGEKRWTEERKKEIVDSRVKTGELLVQSLKTIPNNVKGVISASAIGWYGADSPMPNTKPFVETNAPDDNFLGNTCIQWEAAIKPVEELVERLVIYRIGIVLSKDGGAYPELAKSTKFWVAAILGDGKQVVSWIHIDDVINLYVMAIENENLSGIYNAVAPNPVSNADLVKTIAEVKKKKCLTVHVPEFALNIILGEMKVEVLKSTTVSSNKIESAGYKFSYPFIDDAIKQLENKNN